MGTEMVHLFAMMMVFFAVFGDSHSTVCRGVTCANGQVELREAS
jgi:hypothetical protein